MSYYDLTGKVVWLTGASQGIGEAVARRLARTGCKLAITARSEDKLAALAKELSAGPAVVKYYVADMTNSDQVRAAHAAMVKDLGAVDVYIANAGTYKPADPKTFSAAEYESTMTLNYGGTLKGMEAVLPAMIERRAGMIVGVSSLVGYRGLPRSWPYGATKAAINNFLEGFRFDVERYGLDVVIVNPGFVKTPLTDLNDFEMPFLVTADVAAEHIVAGIRAHKREVHFPWQLSIPSKILRVLPYFIYHAIARKLNK